MGTLAVGFTSWGDSADIAPPAPDQVASWAQLKATLTYTSGMDVAAQLRPGGSELRPNYEPPEPARTARATAPQRSKASGLCATSMPVK